MPPARHPAGRGQRLGSPKISAVDSLRHTRIPIALLLAVAAVLCAGAPAARADTAQVTVVSPGGAEQTLALEALAGSEDVVGLGYVVRGGDGETTQTVTGFSLAKLIDVAGADPYSFSYLEIQRPGGGAVLLSRHQALDRGAFPDGPPVVYADAAGTGFLRPSGGAEDANANDSFLAPQGVSVVLRKGTPLRVKAEASVLRTRPGKPVKFSAVVEQAGAGETLTFSWTFDDGHSAEGGEARHAFSKRGSYEVVLGVTSPGNEAGSSDVVTIQVGAPIEGPDRKGGGRNRDKDAPDHGAAAGLSTGAGSEGGSGIPAPSSPEVSKSMAEPAPQEPAPTAASAPEPAGEEVSGELLAAPTAAELEQDQPQAEARRGNLDGEGSGGGVPAAAWGGLATLGLLGLGGLLEARGLGGLLPGRRGGIA
jgi:PKD domain